MSTNLRMIKFIFTTTYLLLTLINITDTIKFEDTPTKPIGNSNKDAISTNVEYIDDFDDIDERILTGGDRNRKRKSYGNPGSNQNGVSKVKKEFYTSGNVEKGNAHESIDEKLDGNTFNEASGFTDTKRNKGHTDTTGKHGHGEAVNDFTETESGFENTRNVEDVNFDSPNTVIDYCLRNDSVGILPCISQKTVNFLERYSHNTKDINIEENLVLRSHPDENYQSSRLTPLGEDPTDFRTGLEAISTFLQRRTIRYHLQAIYPGLFVVVNPNYQGKGIIEFQLDRHNEIDDRQLSTSGLLIKRNILPRLLGFKISIISIIPIIFAIVFFLTKKAMLLSKLALLVTSFVGFSSISKVLSHGVKAPYHHHHHSGGGGFHTSGAGASAGGQFNQGGSQAYDSLLGGPALFGVATPVLAGGDNDGYLYRKPGLDNPRPGETYNPEPELIFHRPGFKEEADRTGKRVNWMRH